MKTAYALVYQTPVKVCVTCPHCEHEISMPYKDFCDALGGVDPPDWGGREVECTECKKTVEIDGQEWD